MGDTNEPGRLIAAAAKAALSPLGCLRKGQSRVWYSDQKYWIISIEFQPSGWSKGTYLNVGATWLWSERAGFGFSAGYRVVDFVPFESAAQFSPLIVRVAGRAADEVLAMRVEFSSLAQIYDYLLKQAVRDGWPIYHAAVAAGLSGDLANASLLFRRLERWPTHGHDWEGKLKATGAKLARAVDHPDKFRAAVAKLIGRRRMAIGLRPDPHCLG